MDAFECPIGLPYRLFLRRPVNGGDDLQQVHLASIRRVSIDIGQAAHCNSQQSDGCKRRQPGRDGFRAPDRLRVGMRPGYRPEIREACLVAHGSPCQLLSGTAPGGGDDAHGSCNRGRP